MERARLLLAQLSFLDAMANRIVEHCLVGWLVKKRGDRLFVHLDEPRDLSRRNRSVLKLNEILVEPSEQKTGYTSHAQITCCRLHANGCTVAGLRFKASSRFGWTAKITGNQDGLHRSTSGRIRSELALA